MVGFLLGMVFYFESCGQTFDPKFGWPIIGYHLLEEILGLATVIGILVLITIRQRNHPRRPERLSLFSGSNLVAVYAIDPEVLWSCTTCGACSEPSGVP